MAKLSKNAPIEELPEFVSMSKQGNNFDRDKDYSSLNKVIPLKRWLIKQDGRPWNDIYSELCARHKEFEYCPQYPVREMIYWNVDSDIIINKDDGKLYMIGYGSPRLFDPNGRSHGWVGWIHPVTGTFHSYKNKSKNKYNWKNQSSRDDIVVIDEFSQYQKFDGVWYLLKFKKLEYAGDIKRDRHLNALINSSTYVWDWVAKTYMTKWTYHRTACELYNNKDMFCCEKRQLNSKEIKKNKLK